MKQYLIISRDHQNSFIFPNKQHCRLVKKNKNFELKLFFFYSLNNEAQKIPNWNHFNREMIAKDGCDVVCSKGSNQIDQLFIRPVSFP
jgi:hypothetical protein